MSKRETRYTDLPAGREEERIVILQPYQTDEPGMTGDFQKVRATFGGQFEQMHTDIRSFNLKHWGSLIYKSPKGMIDTTSIMLYRCGKYIHFYGESNSCNGMRLGCPAALFAKVCSAGVFVALQYLKQRTSKIS
ncbi:MAG: hypothetical protein PHU42_02045 [Patescibacteria group bacterium]|nr:hypothetical protein [Patescibacteria group bacterium]